MSYPALSDLNNESLVPVLSSSKSSNIGTVSVLISTDLDFNHIRSNALKPKALKFFLSTLFTEAPQEGEGLQKNPVFFAGPYIGAPYGVMLLDSLIARGASKILVLGWCGSISDDLKAGDLVIPAGAISDEGTSKSYISSSDDFPLIKPSATLTDLLKRRVELMNIKFSSKTIWTTDAIYRETAEKVNFFRNRGACAVEMECSALFAAASYRKVEIAALLVVSDEVKSSGWVPGFKKREFKEARKIACRAIVECAKTFNQE